MPPERKLRPGGVTQSSRRGEWIVIVNGAKLVVKVVSGIRMRRVLFAVGVAVGSFPAVAQAQDPVVVELYTSQGCSSCPPADQLLVDLAQQDYVIALALHVDYWDYLGWADGFADPQFSARQRRYARAWNERSVYTPQMVIQGKHYMVGSRGDEIQRQIMLFEDRPSLVTLEAVINGAGAEISVRPSAGPIGASTIYLVKYSDGEAVEISRGENAGQVIHYVNVVQSWDAISNWDGDGPLSMRVNDLRAGNYVVIVQKAGQGEILAAIQIAL